MSLYCFCWTWRQLEARQSHANSRRSHAARSALGGLPGEFHALGGLPGKENVVLEDLNDQHVATYVSSQSKTFSKNKHLSRKVTFSSASGKGGDRKACIRIELQAQSCVDD